MKRLLICVVCILALLCSLLIACSSNTTVMKNGIEYKKIMLNRNGETIECYYVSGCNSKIEILNIASEVNGVPVLGFERNAFQGNINIKEVTIPDTITSISLNEAPFSGCTNIEKLTLATPNVENLFKSYGSGDVNNLDPLPKSLKYIYLTSACTNIPTRSFRYCRYLQELHIPSSVTEIKDGTNKTSIGVNGNVPITDKFEDLPFLGCINLTIYCEANTASDDWGQYWNYIDYQTQAPVVWNGYDSSLGVNDINGTSNTDYRLLATLDSSTISSYNSWTTIDFSNSGLVTLSLDNNNYDPGFRWDLSNYNFSIYCEYKLIFHNLKISGSNTNISYVGSNSITSLRLNWSDSSFSFLKYYNTETCYFDTYLNNTQRFLSLDSLIYNSYSVNFRFNHYNVAASTSKILYFDFAGVEAGGTITFDNLSIYYIEK